MSKENLIIKTFKNKLIAQDIVDLKDSEVRELIAILLWKKQYSKSLDSQFSLDFIIAKICIIKQLKSELEDETINELINRAENEDRKIKKLILSKIKEVGYKFPLLLDDFNGYYN